MAAEPNEMKIGPSVADGSNVIAITEIEATEEHRVTAVRRNKLQKVLDIAESMGWDKVYIWDFYPDTDDHGPLVITPERDSELGVALAPVVDS